MAGLMLLLLLGLRTAPIELGDNMAAPLATLRDRGEADESHEDEEKLRADSPAIFDYACILKCCKGVWGERTSDGFMGVKEWELMCGQTKMGIGMRSWKRLRGQDWLMGELGGRKVESSTWVAWSQINERSQG
jgi:hypothetical protein